MRLNWSYQTTAGLLCTYAFHNLFTQEAMECNYFETLMEKYINYRQSDKLAFAMEPIPMKKQKYAQYKRSIWSGKLESNNRFNNQN